MVKPLYHHIAQILYTARRQVMQGFNIVMVPANLGQQACYSAERTSALSKQINTNIENMPDIVPPKEYPDFLKDVIARIRTAQYEAIKAVNYHQLELYWYLGQQIHAKQRDLEWGKSVAEQLSKDIQIALPGIRGFSSRNLWMMRQWVEVYSASKILQPLVAEIGWSHHQQILSKCKEENFQERFSKCHSSLYFFKIYRRFINRQSLFSY
jgi:predicted nuclease of restriction endonuclease-like (RecB) superfamily